MCGDLDEDNGPAEALYSRFLLNARALLAHHERAKTPDGPAQPYAYMDQLFADALNRAVRDSEAAPAEARYDRLGAQSLVFARLAGLMAAHLAVEEDPLRKVIEALMHGYAEAEAIEPDHGHNHDHNHEHVHGHDHGHVHDSHWHSHREHGHGQNPTHRADADALPGSRRWSGDP